MILFFVIHCREDWNKLRGELGFDKSRGELDFLKYTQNDAHGELLETYAEYDELYDKYNRERLGL